MVFVHSLFAFCRHSSQLILRLYYVFIAPISCGRCLHQRGRRRRDSIRELIGSFNTSAFIATNPEPLLPHSIASTPPLGANLLTPKSLRRGVVLGGPELESLDCEHVFDRLLPMVERKIKETTVPLGWKKGHPRSTVDRTSRFVRSTTLF